MYPYAAVEPSYAGPRKELLPVLAQEVTDTKVTASAIKATVLLTADPSQDRRLFVISNEASYITSVAMPVDSGATA